MKIAVSIAAVAALVLCSLVSVDAKLGEVSQEDLNADMLVANEDQPSSLSETLSEEGVRDLIEEAPEANRERKSLSLSHCMAQLTIIIALLSSSSNSL